MSAPGSFGPGKQQASADENERDRNMPSREESTQLGKQEFRVEVGIG